MATRADRDELTRLAARAAHSDRAAFEALRTRLGPSVEASARSLLSNPSDAEEAVQETWTEAWRRISDLREPRAVEGWLLRIVRTMSYRRLRAAMPEPVHLGNRAWDRVPEPGRSLSDAAIGSEEARRLMSSLPASQRQVVRHCLLDGHGTIETARLLGITPTTVKGRLQRARATLRREMRDVASEHPVKRIAVIDDEPHVVSLLVVHLEAAGYDTLTAPDGEAGLKLIREERPDMVVLDDVMPAMAGWTVIERMRMGPATMDTPVWLLPHLPLDDERTIRARDMAQGCTAKPFNPGSVVAGARCLLGYPPDIAANIAKIRRQKTHREGDPMELVPLLHEGDAQVRMEVVDALAERGEEATDALSALKAPRLLTWIGTDAAFQALSRLVLEDADPMVRLDGLRALDEWHQTEGRLRVVASDGSTMVVRGEIRGLSADEFRQTVEAIVGVIPQMDENDRRTAVEGIATFGGTYITQMLERLSQAAPADVAHLARQLLDGRERPYPGWVVELS